MSGSVLYPGTQLEVEAFIEIIPSDLAEAVDRGDTTFRVYDASRWFVDDWLKIGDGETQRGPAELVQIGSIDAAGETVTIKSGGTLKRPHGIDTPVYRLSAATIASAIQRQDGTETSLTLSSVSTGRYRGTYTTLPADSGPNVVEVNATGTAIGAASAPVSVLTDLV